MVTGYARMKLYSILDKIESASPGRVLYFDTDSVIFVDKATENWYVPPVGDFLGDMTDEIEKDYGSNAYICRFASCGPKNYGYQVVVPGKGIESKVKVKGITMTHQIKDKLNYDLIEKFSEKFRYNKNPIKYLEQHQFRTDKRHNVYSTDFYKMYRTVSDKRVHIFHKTYQTVPFGYIFN